MARYVDDYQGIIGHDVPGTGMDPNYGGPYRGMRMAGGRYQASYGRYRLEHAEDFGGSGGFRGRSAYGLPGEGAREDQVGSGRRYDEDWPGGQGYDTDVREMQRHAGGRPRAAGYDRGWQGGGVRDLRYDRELLHDFNANSPGLQRGSGRYDMEHLRRLPGGVAPWGRGGGNRLPYSNRGISDAGYSEGWAWGPMRGAR